MLERSEASQKSRNCHPNCRGGTNMSAQKATRDFKKYERRDSSHEVRNDRSEGTQ